jgi:hypothetical protein
MVTYVVKVILEDTYVVKAILEETFLAKLIDTFVVLQKDTKRVILENI